MPLYYYDMHTKSCERFIFKGCKPSKNTFADHKKCFLECHREQYQPGVLPQRCTFPKKSGRCKAGILKSYYNTETEKCEAFTYGGCGANANNFEDITECIQLCERFGVGAER